MTGRMSEENLNDSELFREAAGPQLWDLLERVSALNPADPLRHYLKHWHQAEADRLAHGGDPRPVDWAESPYQ